MRLIHHLMLALFLLVAAWPSPAAVQAQEREMATYIVANANLTFQYPAEWVVADDLTDADGNAIGIRFADEWQSINAMQSADFKNGVVLSFYQPDYINRWLMARFGTDQLPDFKSLEEWLKAGYKSQNVRLLDIFKDGNYLGFDTLRPRVGAALNIYVDLGEAGLALVTAGIGYEDYEHFKPLIIEIAQTVSYHPDGLASLTVEDEHLTLQYPLAWQARVDETGVFLANNPAALENTDDNPFPESGGRIEIASVAATNQWLGDELGLAPAPTLDSLREAYETYSQEQRLSLLENLQGDNYVGNLFRIDRDGHVRGVLLVDAGARQYVRVVAHFASYADYLLLKDEWLAMAESIRYDGPLFITQLPA
jgi:hypothetical protein